jgi:hypothetical protein
MNSLNKAFNTINKVIRAYLKTEGSGYNDDAGSEKFKLTIFIFMIFENEKLGMASDPKKEIHGIEDEERYRSNIRQERDIIAWL